MDRVRLGISRCLLGDEVRYDGGHKRDPFLVETFGRCVEWVPVCPEVEMGMGTPREPIQLVSALDGVSSGGHRVRLVGVGSRFDWTPRMAAWRRERLRELAGERLAGYVLKADSPSCGLAGVRVRAPRGAAGTGRGLFAEALVGAMPDLPVEDDRRLHDPRRRESFVERVFAYDRVRQFFAGRWTRGGLGAFHAAHALQLLSHSRGAHDALGRLVARADELGRREIAALYGRGLMDALRRPPTAARHSAVLLQAAARLGPRLDDRSRREIVAAVEDYRRGAAPLVVPVTLIRHHVRRLGVQSLAGQTYLEPHPDELCLRNHA